MTTARATLRVIPARDTAADNAVASMPDGSNHATHNILPEPLPERVIAMRGERRPSASGTMHADDGGTTHVAR